MTACRCGRRVMEARSVEKQNQRARKFAAKDAAESSVREYELFGAVERTAKVRGYLEKVVTHAKID